MPVAEWTEALKDCRGLILDADGNIVGRPFRKFWNAGQTTAPSNEPFCVWEKMDGSLGIVCVYAGERIAATRGSFESDQAIWLQDWLERNHADFWPSGETYLFEIIFPANRIVVDYGDRAEAVLLSVMSPDCADQWNLFEACHRFKKARRFDGISEFSTINSDPLFAGAEGFVVQYESGYREKVKLEEYCRLHRLITQYSTRTIWEMLRSGAGVQELLDRVPVEFAEWVTGQATAISVRFEWAKLTAMNAFSANAHLMPDRKCFAEWAKKEMYPSLLFLLLDGKSIDDACWKLAEPKWATPFRKDIDA
jgi:RNA ligase